MNIHYGMAIMHKKQLQHSTVNDKLVTDKRTMVLERTMVLLVEINEQ